MPNKLGEAGISWVIIGSQTRPYKPPQIEWVREIVEAADKAGVKVFLKNNLRPLLHHGADEDVYPLLIDGDFALRQEMPHAI